MAVIVFCGVAGKVLLADYKRLLVNGLNLGQPSFIYAYLALLVQSGKYNWFTICVCYVYICPVHFSLIQFFIIRLTQCCYLSTCLFVTRFPTADRVSRCLTII